MSWWVSQQDHCCDPTIPLFEAIKMKKHRGAITARMLANLLVMAGADHVVSMDLHASQMQGFSASPWTIYLVLLL